MSIFKSPFLTGVLFLSLATQVAGQEAAGVRPDILDDVEIEQHLDEALPLNLHFFDETGTSVQLGEYFGKKPVVLALVYYECPMLCTMILNGMLKALNVMDFNVGDEFQIVTVSFDPGETAKMAAEKKATYLKQYGREGAADGWHFLTGDEANIRELADAAGFKYKYNPENDEYVHASGIMVVTPEGHLSKYFYGVEYSPRDLKLGLIEASENRIGSAVDQILLYCYHYDPTTGKYGVVIMNVIRLLGVTTVAFLVIFIGVMLRRDRKVKAKASTT